MDAGLLSCALSVDRDRLPLMPDTASCLPRADYLEPSRFGMFMSVYRQEILATIYTEIARLRRARFLIARSVVPGHSDKRPSRRPLPAKRGKGKPVASGVQLTPSAHGERQTQQKLETPVRITRLPTKEAPRQRVTRAETTRRTALNGEVPQGPIAVPRNKHRETTNVLGVSVAHTSSAPSAAPASAFGLAITRELASL